MPSLPQYRRQKQHVSSAVNVNSNSNSSWISSEQEQVQEKLRQDSFTPTKQLDESDATSMATTTSTCTATPSPSPRSMSSSYHHPKNDTALSSAEVSPSNHSSSSSRNSQHQHHGGGVLTSYSLLSALTSSPTDNSDSLHQSPTAETSNSGGSSNNSSNSDCWSDTEDYLVESGQEQDKQEEIDRATTTRGTPSKTNKPRASWRAIKGQALFPDDSSDEENENRRLIANSNNRTPTRRSSDSVTSRRTILQRRREQTDAPSEEQCTRASWTPSLSSSSSSSPLQQLHLQHEQQQQHHQSNQPIRTRRSKNALFSTSPVDTTASDAQMPSGFVIPKHRRRNSTGTKKCHSSPDPHTGGGRHSPVTPVRNATDKKNDTNTTSSRILQPPNSHSKTKKKPQHFKKALELPGLLLLDERSSFHNSKRSSSPLSSSITTTSRFESTAAASKINSRGSSLSAAWLCRIRLTTMVWGLVLLGVTMVTKTAMMASEPNMLMHPKTSPEQQLVQPTGGLRGSLLMSTVRLGRKPSESKDHRHHDVIAKNVAAAVAANKGKKKKDNENNNNKKKNHNAAVKKDKKDKEKGKKKDTKKTASKHHNQHHNDNHQHHNHEHEKNKVQAVATKKMTEMHLPRSHGPRSVVRPFEPLVVSTTSRAFEDQDVQMYASSAKASTAGATHAKRQMLILHEDIIEQTKSSYEVERYPADFTDNTQYYGVYDSADERLQTMELREPYEDGECVPMQDWQTTYHPSCNGVHELGMEYLGEDSSETNFQLFGTKGYWRYAWRLDLHRTGNSHHYESQTLHESAGDTVVLKTLKFQHNFEDAHFEHDRIDAVAMERLTSSPHVINVFGFCGHSVLTEYANGPRLGELADKSRIKPLARLKIARDIANGLADVHGIDAPDGNNATFVHLDINPANVISIGGTLKLNDFNIGIIRRWNITSQKPCGFPAQYPNPQWRSPEEARDEMDLTEKVDVFSMGHIFFRLICGHEPWNKLEPGGKPSKEDINEKVKKGVLPTIPDSVMNTTDPEVAAIRDVMLECYRADPNDRPTAREITSKLEAVLKTLAA